MRDRLPTTISTTKRFGSVYEINMYKEKEEPHSEDEESFKELKDKSELFLIFPNSKKLCLVEYKLISLEGNFEF